MALKIVVGAREQGTLNWEQEESFGRFYFSSHTFKFFSSPTYYLFYLGSYLITAQMLSTYTFSQFLTPFFSFFVRNPGSPNFNFIYDTNSGKVLQSGNPLSSTGFSIGSDSGYLLESTSGNGINFTDAINFNNDSGLTGSLNATPVPFESSPVAPLTVLPILGLMGFYRQRQRRKMVALNK